MICGGPFLKRGVISYFLTESRSGDNCPFHIKEVNAMLKGDNKMFNYK